jgi:plastocyanin
MKCSSFILGTSAVGLLIAALTLRPGAFQPAAEATAAAATEGAPAAEVQVKIDNFSFAPATITIPAGTVVRWVNKDEVSHQVVSNDHSFKSKVLDAHEEFTHSFATSGTYSYFCSIHSSMTGKIVVE